MCYDEKEFKKTANRPRNIFKYILFAMSSNAIWYESTDLQCVFTSTKYFLNSKLYAVILMHFEKSFIKIPHISQSLQWLGLGSCHQSWSVPDLHSNLWASLPAGTAW